VQRRASEKKILREIQITHPGHLHVRIYHHDGIPGVEGEEKNKVTARNSEEGLRDL
jgi:hypothetical protein